MRLKATVIALSQTLWSYGRVLRLSKRNLPPLPKSNTKEIVLLGNGPSFKETLDNELEYLSSHDTFGVNHLCKQKEYLLLKPSSYLLMDSKIYLKDVDNSYVSIKEKLFDTLVEKTSWEMNLFVPAVTDIKEEFDALMQRNPRLKVHYFNLTTLEGIERVVYRWYDKNLGMPFAGNVMVAAIMLAIHMGYERIKLVGADHSFHLVTTVNDDNHFCVQESHYYQEKKVDIPMYSDVKKEHRLLTHEYFKHTAMQFQSYHYIEAYARSKGVAVINASAYSFIDAFRRQKLQG